MTSIEIPNGVTGIGVFAFGNCESLESIVIPESVIEIGDCAFWECKSLKTVKISNGVKSIGLSAFEGCPSLKTVNIPDSVKELGDNVFFECPALKEWLISPTHPHFQSAGAGLLTKDGKTFLSCLCSAKEYQIPEGVTTIKDHAFYGCNR